MAPGGRGQMGEERTPWRGDKGGGGTEAGMQRAGVDKKGTDRKAKGPVRLQKGVPRGKLTLLRRTLILLPLALPLSDTMPPTPGTSSARFLQLQCTFASLQGGGEGSLCACVSEGPETSVHRTPSPAQWPSRSHPGIP